MMQNIYQKHDIERSGRPRVADVQALKRKLGAGRDTGGPAGHTGSQLDPLPRHVKPNAFKSAPHSSRKTEQQTRTATNIENPLAFAYISD
jgi:hypothetical protein